MTTFSAHPLLQMLGLGQVPQAVKPGVQMQPGFMGRINAGVRRSAGMPQQRFPLQGYPENPSLQGQPPLQWAVPNHAGGEMQLTNAGGQAYGMPAGPQRDSTTAVPMGGWQNHPSTRGLQEYKPTTPMYQRLHDITNPAPSPLIGNPGGLGLTNAGGKGVFSVPPENTPSAPRFTNGPFGPPGPDVFGGHGVNQASQGPAAHPSMQPQSPLGQKPWWQRDLFTADDHLPQRTPTGAHLPSWPSTPMLDKSIFGIKAAMGQWIPQDAAKNLGRLGINVPEGMVKGGMPQAPSVAPAHPAAPMMPPESGGQSSVWGLPQARIPAPPPPRPANGAMSEDEANRYVDQTLGAQQRYQQAKERAVMANHRPEPAAFPASDLQPTAPLYPAHPYSGKFPIQRTSPAPTPVTDNGMDNRAALAQVQSGAVPSNLIPVRPGMTPEQAKAASDQAFANNKRQWAKSDQRRAENATKEFEAKKLEYQRRRELAALAPRRRSMAEDWIQSQYRMENPAMFARGVNPDMLRFMAAANAHQRMDAPQFGGGYSPMEAEMFRQKLYAENAHNFQNTPQNPTAAEDFRRMLGMGPPNGNNAVPPQKTAIPQQSAFSKWVPYLHAQVNPGQWLGQRFRSMMGF